MQIPGTIYNSGRIPRRRQPPARDVCVCEINQSLPSTVQGVFGGATSEMKSRSLNRKIWMASASDIIHARMTGWYSLKFVGTSGSRSIEGLQARGASTRFYLIEFNCLFAFKTVVAPGWTRKCFYQINYIIGSIWSTNSCRNVDTSCNKHTRSLRMQKA